MPRCTALGMQLRSTTVCLDPARKGALSVLPGLHAITGTAGVARLWVPRPQRGVGIVLGLHTCPSPPSSGSRAACCSPCMAPGRFYFQKLLGEKTGYFPPHKAYSRSWSIARASVSIALIVCRCHARCFKTLSCFFTTVLPNR